jgi:2-polyprenyl-6-methoxyphenol hydroxylase-like FAD-dependent oxidoreductase
VALTAGGPDGSDERAGVRCERGRTGLGVLASPVRLRGHRGGADGRPAPGLGGHAVDLFGPAVDIVERMGILPQVQAARTGTDLLSFERPGKPALEVDFRRLAAGISPRHVEIMRGELASILYEATRDDVEYVFGDSIRTLDQDSDGVNVTFEHGTARRFGLVVGADGLHSTVRGLTFGEESQFRRYIGGYFAVFTLPNYLDLHGRMLIYTMPGKVAAMYPVRQTGQARAGFLFRRAAEFNYDHRDIEHQKRLLQETFAEQSWQLPRMLAELDSAPDLYFDSISQIRLNTWSRGRVTLVGDAGYCPGPAVGGGTTVAIVGAYVLAGEMLEAAGDHRVAFRNYENEMREFVLRSRTIGPSSMKTLIPATAWQVWLAAQVMRIVPRLPVPLQRTLTSLQGGPARTLESISLKGYQPAAQ